MEGADEVAVVHRGADVGGEHEVLVVPSLAGGEPLGELLLPVIPQGRGRVAVEGDGAPASLGLRLGERARALLEGVPDRQGRAREVDGLPAQAEKLSLPQSRRDRESVERLEPVAAGPRRGTRAPVPRSAAGALCALSSAGR